MTLQDELRKLSAQHRSELMQAFELEIDLWVVVRDNVFVGVNIVDDPRLDILETQGVWSYGRLRST